MVVALTLLRTVGWAAAVIPQGFVGTIYAIEQHLRDVICVDAVQFKTGTILLSGLYVYDIGWVFGTEVVSGIKLSRYYGYLEMEMHDAGLGGYCHTWTVNCCIAI